MPEQEATHDSIDEFIESVRKDSPVQRFRQGFDFISIGRFAEEGVVEDFKRFDQRAYDKSTGNLCNDIGGFTIFVEGIASQFGDAKQDLGVSMRSPNLEQYMLDSVVDVPPMLQKAHFKDDFESMKLSLRLGYWATSGEIIFQKAFSEGLFDFIFLTEMFDSPKKMIEAVAEEVIAEGEEGFSVLEKKLSSKLKGEPFWMKNDNTDDVSLAAKIHEDDYLKMLVNSALMIDSLHFDLKNLAFREYTDEDIARCLMNGPDLSDQPEEAQMIAGFGSFFVNRDAQALMSRKKKEYISEKKAVRIAQYSMPVALRLYALNISKEITEKIKEDEKIQKIAAFMIRLKQCEFREYADANDFIGYIWRLRNKEDLNSIKDCVMRIENESSDDMASPAYMDLFTKPDNRDRDSIAFLTSDKFAAMWISAFNSDWGSQAYENFYGIKEVIGKPECLDRLILENSGSLPILLSHKGFNDFFKKNPGIKADFGLLEELLEIDSKLFEKVYSSVGEGDGLFLSSLINLSVMNGYDYSGLIFTSGLKKFIAGIGELNEAGLASVAFTLQNFGIAERAVNYGLCPGKKKIEQIEDKIGFAEWFIKNKARLTRETAEISAAMPYLGNSTSLSLRRTVIELYRAQGKDFCDKYLSGFSELGQIAYQRICSLFGKVDNAKLICRKRELKQPLEAMAAYAREDEWVRFKDEMVLAKEEAYEGILSKYGAVARSRAMSIAGKINGTAKTVDSYLSVTGSGHSHLVDRLIDVNERVNAEVFEKVCGHIVKGNVRLAEFAVSQIELGMNAEEAETLLDFYTQDCEMDAINPAEVTRIYEQHAEEAVAAAVAARPAHQFDYTAFNEYSEAEGFSPAVVRNIVEDGFKLGTAGKYIGMHYLPFEHISKTAIGKAEDKAEVHQNFEKIISWLKRENVLIHHTRKGRSLKGGCLSINPQLRDIASAPLRDYMRHTLYAPVASKHE